MIKAQFIPLAWLEFSPFICCYSYETYIFPIQQKFNDRLARFVVLNV
jgi:hypothetical protein